MDGLLSCLLGQTQAGKVKGKEKETVTISYTVGNKQPALKYLLCCSLYSMIIGPLLLELKNTPGGCPGGGGMNWEIGIDIYTLICIK